MEVQITRHTMFAIHRVLKGLEITVSVAYSNQKLQNSTYLSIYANVEI